jgi:hypothetical protein
MQCCFLNDATKQEVTENRIFEGTDCLKAALESGITSLQYMFACARSVVCRNNRRVILLYLIIWPSTVTYRVKTQDSKCYDSHL